MKQESGEIPDLSRHKGQHVLSFILKKRSQMPTQIKTVLFARGRFPKFFCCLLLKRVCKVCLAFIQLFADFKNKRFTVRDIKIRKQFRSTVATKSVSFCLTLAKICILQTTGKKAERT
jgi:hypothetical protein